MNRITHATYVVPDTDRALAFLSSVLGFTTRDDDVTITGERFLTVAPVDSPFALQVIESCSYQSDKGTLGIVEFIIDTDDMDAVINRAKAKNLEIVREPIEAPYGRTAIIRDPFGNLWDLIQRPQTIR